MAQECPEAGKLNIPPAPRRGPKGFISNLSDRERQIYSAGYQRGYRVGLEGRPTTNALDRLKKKLLQVKQLLNQLDL